MTRLQEVLDQLFILEERDTPFHHHFVDPFQKEQTDLAETEHESQQEVLGNVDQILVEVLPQFLDYVVVEDGHVTFEQHIFVYLLELFLFLLVFEQFVDSAQVLVITHLFEILLVLAGFSKFGLTVAQLFLDNVACDEIVFEVHLVHDKRPFERVLFTLVLGEVALELFLFLFEELVLFDLFPREAVRLFHGHHVSQQVLELGVNGRLVLERERLRLQQALQVFYVLGRLVAIERVQAENEFVDHGRDGPDIALAAVLLAEQDLLKFKREQVQEVHRGGCLGSCTSGPGHSLRIHARNRNRLT